MQKFSLKFFKSFIIFSRNFLGTVNSPYPTFRKLSQTKDSGQLIFIFLLVTLYFAFATTIRTGVSNPYLLTLQFNKLIAFTALTFILFILIIYSLGKLLTTQGNLRSISLCWAYTLIPTFFWFLFTSFSYILLPPPRTLSFPGKLFSLIFITFSLGILFWKIVLYYLTLRFSLKIGLLKIMIISAVVAPSVAIYGLIMYRLGVFRIPFI